MRVAAYQSKGQAAGGRVKDGWQEDGQICAPDKDQEQIYHDEDGDNDDNVSYAIQQIKVIIALEGVQDEGEDESE